MLSTAMQYNWPTGPQAPKPGLPYHCVGDTISSPTYLPSLQSPLSYYARSQFPFSTTPSVVQGIQLATATAAKANLSSESAAATLIALQEPVVHSGEANSPSACKLEQRSPESAATPPISVTCNEADSSTANEHNNPVFESAQEEALPIEVSEQHHGQESAIATYPVMYSDAARMPGPSFPDVSFSQTTPLQLPYAPATSYSQTTPNAYTTFRYGPAAPTMQQLSAFPCFPQLPPRRDEIFPRNNSCHMCGKTYARQSTLKTHLRSHSGEKPYQCSICQKSFTQAANLTAHLRTHSGEKPFKCPICNRGFSQSSSVTTHMRTHSGDRPYKCQVCNKGFADSSTLTKHFRTHTGEKPYQCKICEARFSQSGNLNRHMRTHKNRFPLRHPHHQL